MPRTNAAKAEVSAVGQTVNREHRLLPIKVNGTVELSFRQLHVLPFREAQPTSASD